MKKYEVSISDDKDKILKRIAKRVGQKAEVAINKQGNRYIERLLIDEAKHEGILLQDDLKLSRDQEAELLALLLNTKDDFLKSLEH